MSRKNVLLYTETKMASIGFYRFIRLSLLVCFPDCRELRYRKKKPSVLHGAGYDARSRPPCGCTIICISNRK